ncbi:hypothetical protein AVTE2539_15330 [Acidovorax sp. SUPP2539]|nr:hypothetical protein AVTE2539_15330 [Acidovorax sp. SUPP2539]
MATLDHDQRWQNPPEKALADEAQKMMKMIWQ